MDSLASRSDVRTKLERCAFVAFLREGKTMPDGPREENAYRSSFEGKLEMDVLYVLHNIAECEQRALGSGTDQECMKGRSRGGKADDVDAQVVGELVEVLASHDHENPYLRKREYSPFREAFVEVDQTSRFHSGWSWGWNLQID